MLTDPEVRYGNRCNSLNILTIFLDREDERIIGRTLWRGTSNIETRWNCIKPKPHKDEDGK